MRLNKGIMRPMPGSRATQFKKVRANPMTAQKMFSKTMQYEKSYFGIWRYHLSVLLLATSHEKFTETHKGLVQ